MSESKQDAEELLRKAREYVEKHESKKSRKDKKDKKKKHSSRSREEDEHSRRRKDRDGKEGKNSKRERREKDSPRGKKRTKSGRHRNGESDKSLEVDSSHGRKVKETSKSTSKDKKRSRDKKSEDESSKRNSRSKASRHDDDSSSGGNDQKKDKKRQKRSQKEKDDHHKSKKLKRKDKKRMETKSSSSRGSEEINKISSIVGPITDKEPKKKISSDDYFTYHNHLRLFLYHKEGIYFEDLSSTETHKAFKKFCDKYNAGQLERAYYSENLKLPDEAMDACKRTKHRWNFNTSSTEQRSLDLIKSGVKKQTEYHSNNSVPSRRSLSLPPPGPAMQCLPAGDAGAQRRNNGNQRERPKVPERSAEPGAKTNVDAAAKDKQDAMLKMLGIKAGQKITIAPRK